MDDYSVKNLIDSKNEWCSRLLNIFTPCVIYGFNTILDESYKLCIENDEYNKYLITFQNFLSRVPKWNNNIIEDEKKRIIEASSCKYIEDLITCVHIIHLKAITYMRVGEKQKKIDLDIPSLDKFVHNVYINSARKLYTNVYLFEKNIPSLEIQKNNREIELIIKECIMNTIHDSIPVEDILNKYLSETIEDKYDITEEVVEVNDFNNEPDVNVEVNKELKNTPNENLNENLNDSLEKTPINDKFEKLNFKKPVSNKENNQQNIKFDNIDKTIDNNGNKEDVFFSKDITNLENKVEGVYGKIDDDEDDKPLLIGEDVNLDISDINNLNYNNSIKLDLEPIELDIETL